ncbi:MAG: hypothetical protein KFF77_05195 [Bacteroidetes bacterium]|nr:hypothetical protein [Bacteroidota bacterium]
MTIPTLLRRSTLLVLLLLAVPAQAQRTIETRKDTVFAFFRDADTGLNYAAAAARVLETATRPDGLAMLEELTTIVTPDPTERFRMTTVYVRLHDILPDSMRARIEYIWASFPLRPFDGEHEEVAYYSSLYLMCHFGGTDAAFYNGRSLNENRNDARAWLLHWMQEVTERGQRQFDSPTYAALMLVSMVLLRDFAPDEDMRRRSELMAQWLLADFAHDYLNGAYCGAHARENMLASLLNPVASDMSGPGWLYFGDGPQVYGREQFFLALSDFTPLDAIVELAINRTEPYESWERKRSAVRYRSSDLGKYAKTGAYDTDAEDVPRYTYMHPLFAMGSIPGGQVQPREQHSWDVTWIPKDPQKPATLFVMHPYFDPVGLRPFIPHSPEIALRAIGLLDSYFGTVTQPAAGSPFEDVFQHRNTLIALYDIGQVSRFPLVAGFLPPEYKKMDVDSTRSGWITINTGDVYLAVYPLAPYRIVDGMFGKHLFSPHKRNGVIVHVAGRNTAGSYEQFRKAVRETKVDTSRFASDASIRYTTPDGDVFAFTFAGTRTVNGESVMMKEDMLFDSPRLQSKRGSGALTIRSTEGDVTIDMRALRIDGATR